MLTFLISGDIQGRKCQVRFSAAHHEKEDGCFLYPYLGRMCMTGYGVNGLSDFLGTAVPLPAILTIMGLTSLSRWVIKTGMAVGTAMPRLLAATGGLSLMVKGCSEEERLMLGSKTAVEVSVSVLLILWRSCMVAFVVLALVGPNGGVGVLRSGGV